MSDVLLVTVVEAARMLGLGRSLTYSLIARGDLPSVKISGARRVAVADIESFIARLRAEAADEPYGCA